ncbi:MAG: aspartate kinase [Saprospiraceae bacterium]|nr:aspartate kinase [Saprospiraceae bacterium]
MKVFKFGGASAKDPEGLKNIRNIILQYGASSPLVVVISAIGKTTNALEEVVNAKLTDKSKAFDLLRIIRKQHESYIEQLFGKFPDVLMDDINEHFVEAEWLLDEDRKMHYDYMYDQIVSVGELVSSRILYHWLIESGSNAQWVDAREIIRTDETWREGRIQWEMTNSQISHRLLPLLQSGKMVVTQGFIGSTSENNTVTLGREGSDYTAAIISSALDVQDMTIWKDVPGVLTGDPRIFDHVSKLDRLSYTEAIEMTYYGAKVIHPKTIQPLENAQIPLYVKSFIHPELPGTYVSGDPDPEYPPIVVLEPNQALVHFSSRDLSFIAEYHLARLFILFDRFRIRVNMMRSTAISFTICTQNDESRLKQLFDELKDEFRIVVDPDLELYTVRHYNEYMLPELFKEKLILLEEKIRNTVQRVVKKSPPIVHKKMVE